MCLLFLLFVSFPCLYYFFRYGEFLSIFCFRQNTKRTNGKEGLLVLYTLKGCLVVIKVRKENIWIPACAGMTGTLDSFLPQANRIKPRGWQKLVTWDDFTFHEWNYRKTIIPTHVLDQSYIHPCYTSSTPERADGKAQKNPLYHRYIRGYFYDAILCKRHHMTELDWDRRIMKVLEFTWVCRGILLLFEWYTEIRRESRTPRTRYWLEYRALRQYYRRRLHQ